MNFFDRLKSVFKPDLGARLLYDERVRYCEVIVDSLKQHVQDLANDVEALVAMNKNIKESLFVNEQNMRNVIDEYKNLMDIDHRLQNVKRDFEYFEDRKKGSKSMAKRKRHDKYNH